MSKQEPVAFLSYVRADDEHDHGRITALRERLEGEVRMHTGRVFKIFQDKRDIKWGEMWRQRLDSTLLNVTFLIPIVTPSYFYSDMCRDEFEKFLLRERQLGENRLILPIYYVESDQILNVGASAAPDDIAKAIASRNWADWRSLRFKDLKSTEVESSISEMAITIKSAMKELDLIIVASKASPKPLPSPVVVTKDDFERFSPITSSLKQDGGSASKRPTRRGPYYAYTTKYDEIVAAEDLSNERELNLLSKILNKNIRSIKACTLN